MDKDIIKKLKVSLYYISGANIFTSLAMVLLYFQTKEIYLLVAAFIMIGVGIAFFLGSDKIIQMIIKDTVDRENQKK
ncbi:MAG: hypothetical protein ACOVNU_00305 [Candidatus Kapaibacteriota bacterium]|jgi:hypothetical protein